MGNVTFDFKPRRSLSDFTNDRSKISLIKKVSGKRDSHNKVINGENLAALAALKAGAGVAGSSVEVDMIYIDPPYNVGGNQGYKNIWKGKSEKERDWAGDHGAFLDFMEPRIKIGRSLLKEDGVMFVSICDGEYCRLKILIDQIFGASNCLGTIIWNKTGGSQGQHLSAVHEYILVYAKDATLCPSLCKEKEGADPILEKADELKKLKLGYLETQKKFRAWILEQKKKKAITAGEAEYKYLHPETLRPFRVTASCAQDKPESRCQKKLVHPVTGKKCPVPSKGWKWSEKTLDSMAEFDRAIIGNKFVMAGKLFYGADEKSVPGKIKYLDEDTSQRMPTVINLAPPKNKDLPSGISFSTPKPVDLIVKLLKSYPKKDAIILDYFAGSGTTAQAAEKLNQMDGGSRTWIMIEEMQSTFNLVLMKRLESIMSSPNYGIFELTTANVGDKELMRVFGKYSKDFISSYHLLNTDVASSEKGLEIIGFDERSMQLVGICNPSLREGKNVIEKELKILKDMIKKTGAKKVLLYTINDGNPGFEEPWKGIDKHILVGTTCKELRVVEIPEQLVEEWEEVLTAMAA